MKIAFIVRQYSKTGGVGRTVADLTPRLLARGHTVAVYCADPPPRAASDPCFIPVPIPRRPFLLRAALFPRRASDAAARGGFDIIHGHGNDCRGADVLTAHSCHRYAMTFLRRTGGLYERIKKTFNPVHPLVFANERFNYSRAGHRRVIAVSARVKEEIVATYDLPAERITVIPNGVDLSTFHPRLQATARHGVRTRLGLGAEPLLLFAGHEFERKGLPVLLAALARLRNRQARLLIVGRPCDAYTAHLLRRLGVAGRVHFTGSVADIAAHFAACDLFVFPTRYEPFGLVIAEAMASGLAVLTTRVAGAADEIRHGQNGMLVDLPLQSEQIAAEIDRLLENDELRRRLGAAGRRTAEECWNWETIAERTETVYRRVLAEKAARGATSR